MVGWILGFFAAMVLLGFALGGALLSVLYLRFAAHERWRVSVGYGVAVLLLLLVVFQHLLAIPFPPGLVFEWLGFEL